VSGDISIVNPNGNVSYSGATIGGTSNSVLIQDHIHKGVQEPDFPDIDTSAYAAFATTGTSAASCSTTSTSRPT
jgi:hypothetical protein